MSVLDEINEKKRTHVEARKSAVPLVELKAQIRDVPAPLGFIEKLRNDSAPAIIAEIKKASPSKGIIRTDFDPVEIAKIYEENGASCISVLTDEPYFQGSDAYLKAVKAVSSLPVLRKDFMVDEYQIYESRTLGADCILLIMASLGDDEAKTLYETASELEMGTLFEVHDQEELERALALEPKLLGVNNRNLKTLDVDLQTSLDLAAQIPDSVLKVAESGISGQNEIKSLAERGYKAFLIGENLMRSEDIGAALRSLKT